MSERSGHRRPAAFRLDDPRVVLRDADDDANLFARGTIRITPEPDPALLPVPLEETVLPPKRRAWLPR